MARQIPEDRLPQLLDAATRVFVEQGYRRTQMADVAAAMGVAKGTLYLFSMDKEDLFEQVAIDAVAPVLQRVTLIAEQADLPFGAMLTGLLTLFQREVLDTRRREIMRLVIAEGARFPRIAQFYHREVISRGLAAISSAAGRAHVRGELPSDALTRFPQLLFGPMLLSMIWRGLFESYQPLDVAGLLAAHRDLLLGLQPQAKQP